MSSIRNQYYRYNPETDNFERVFPTLGHRLAVATRYIGLSLLVGGLLFVIAWYSIDSPGERELREQNAILKQQYELLNRRIDNSLKVMDALQNRDDNFYRVLLQMQPVGDSQRNAGLNSERRYRDLPRMSDGGLVKLLTQRVDFLERQLYTQSLSFDQIKEVADSRSDELSHIPSILPIAKGTESVSGGYGIRRDPVSKRSEFHPGIDFAVKEGTPVVATAAGRISEARRHSGMGNVVAINHGHDYESRYAHLSEIIVAPGVVVNRGDIIGYSGSSGRSTAPHLHYEVRIKGEPQNPVNFFFMQLNPEEFSAFKKAADSAADVMD